jgi:hypothetical protein
MVESSSLAYNRCETWDKQPLGRDLDSVKLSWLQSMDPWTEQQLVWQ